MLRFIETGRSDGTFTFRNMLQGGHYALRVERVSTLLHVSANTASPFSLIDITLLWELVRLRIVRTLLTHGTITLILLRNGSVFLIGNLIRNGGRLRWATSWQRDFVNHLVKRARINAPFHWSYQWMRERSTPRNCSRQPTVCWTVNSWSSPLP